MNATTTATIPDSVEAARDARKAAMLARRQAERAATVPAAKLAEGAAILLPIDLPGEHFFAAGSPAIVAAVEPGRLGTVAVTVACDFGRIRTMSLAPATPVRLG